jgi:hypothetical protein
MGDDRYVDLFHLDNLFTIYMHAVTSCCIP